MLKKVALTVPLALSIFISACQSRQYTKYQCPMKCEGEKTYKKADHCPVCEMELEGVE